MGREWPTRPINVGTIALSPAAKLLISIATGVMATDWIVPRQAGLSLFHWHQQMHMDMGLVRVGIENECLSDISNEYPREPPNCTSS